jgi:hypothetical protein
MIDACSCRRPGIFVRPGVDAGARPVGLILSIRDHECSRLPHALRQRALCRRPVPFCANAVQPRGRTSEHSSVLICVPAGR